MRPKTYFLRPDVAVPLGFALLRELWAQKVRGRPDGYVMPPLPAAAAPTNGKSPAKAANGKK